MLKSILLAAALCACTCLPAAAQQRCTYDECALRIMSATLTTPPKLVRGARDVEVVPLGMFEPAIAPFVTLSDSAVAYARVYDVMFDRGSVITLAGTGTAIVAPILMTSTMQKIVWTGIGIGASVYGGVLTNRANDALARAIWWYNRELPR